MLLIGRERGKGQIGKIPGPSPSKSGKSQKNRENPKKDKKPCPSFPWSFRKYQGKPQKHQGFFWPCEPLKTLKRSTKHSKRPRIFAARKTPRKQKDQGKEGQGRTKKEGQVQIGKPPRLNPPRLAALEYKGHWVVKLGVHSQVGFEDRRGCSLMATTTSVPTSVPTNNGVCI